MAAPAPFTVPPPPDLPAMPELTQTFINYLRTFSLWAKDSFSTKIDSQTATPGVLFQGYDAPARTAPNVFNLQVNQDGVISLAPVPLGSTPLPTTSTTPVPVFPEAPSDGSSYGRTDESWVAVLPLTGGTLTGALVLNGPPGSSLEATTKTYVDSAVSSGVSSGTAAYLPLAGGTLTGALTGVDATFSDLLTVGGFMGFTTLPGSFINDAGASAGGVPVGGVYRNGSILMVRVA